MTPGSSKIVIIGGGVAGLCAGVYAQTCGYQAEVLEQHTTPGGLATSWKRGEYTFETCIHWLVGSSPEGWLNAEWREVFDIDQLTFVYAEEYQRVESDDGQSLRVYSNVDRMEAEFLRQAPEDAEEIKAFTAAIRVLADLPMQDLMNGPWPRRAWAMLRLAPSLPLLQHWAAMSAADYGKRFKHELLRRFFGDSGTAEMSVIALVFMFAWMNRSNAGYPIGGSKAIVNLMGERFRALGGTLRTDVRVANIIVENDIATGVHLANGETIGADWVVSAADGHATIYDLLGGEYKSDSVDRLYAKQPVFPSYVQVSLGVAQDLSGEPGYLARILREPLQVDPETALTTVTFRTFHYDPTFAPRGKTAITCFLPTFNFAYWVQLQCTDPAHYDAEKTRIANAVVAVLDRRSPGLRDRVETVDVSTPASVVRFTGNWKGSMEGFLPTPGSLFASRRQTLPGLSRLLRVGQWVSPGGGLPTGLMTARAAIESICRQDGVPFLPQATAPTIGQAA
jgi:phytoene dehydrogenase-like protein